MRGPASTSTAGAGPPLHESGKAPARIVREVSPASPPGSDERRERLVRRATRRGAGDVDCDGLANHPGLRPPGGSGHTPDQRLGLGIQTNTHGHAAGLLNTYCTTIRPVRAAVSGIHPCRTEEELRVTLRGGRTGAPIDHTMCFVRGDGAIGRVCHLHDLLKGRRGRHPDCEATRIGRQAGTIRPSRPFQIEGRAIASITIRVASR